MKELAKLKKKLVKKKSFKKNAFKTIAQNRFKKFLMLFNYKISKLY